MRKQKNVEVEGWKIVYESKPLVNDGACVRCRGVEGHVKSD